MSSTITTLVCTECGAAIEKPNATQKHLWHEVRRAYCSLECSSTVRSRNAKVNGAKRALPKLTTLACTECGSSVAEPTATQARLWRAVGRVYCSQRSEEDTSELQSLRHLGCR